jgi:hypothetical protein
LRGGTRARPAFIAPRNLMEFQMFNQVRNVSRKYGPQLVAVSAVLSATAANAALDAGAAAMFTDAAVSFALVLAAGYILMTAVTGGWITFDMVKKGAKKAAK